MIDFFASERHFIDHLAPIYKAIDGARFLTTPRLFPYLEGLGIAPSGGEVRDIVVVASWGDLKRMRPREIIFVEHGVGFQFGDKHPSYSGGYGRDAIGLYLATNEYVARQQRDSYPDQDIRVIGAPKLDRWHLGKVIPRDEKVIAISFHWDCMVAPETRTAFEHYRRVLPYITEQYLVLGHGHPRDWQKYGPYWGALGVRQARDFDDVMRLADIYIADSTSTLYEFASTGRPVVVLNSPEYRRGVQHGLRFWDYIPGLMVDHPLDLPEAIQLAMSDPHWLSSLRESAVKVAYPNRGKATLAARDAILSFLAGRKSDYA